jgi:hypothetical protein
MHSSRSSHLSAHGPSVDGLADLLEPAPPPVDLAFADTFFARDLPEDAPPPPSGPIVVSDATGQTQHLTPIAYPLPAAAVNAPLSVRVRVGASRLRHGARAAVEDVRDLWADTDHLTLPRRMLVVLQRARDVWASWEWDRADVLRAGAIGLVVFVTAAAFGAGWLD